MCSLHCIRRLLASLTLLIATLGVCTTSYANTLRTALYDAQIRKWNSFYTPSIPWYWNKAQLRAESNLNTNATSPVGAMGLGQFMPATWSEVSKQLGFPSGVSAYASSYNIQAQAYYMRNLRNNFKKDRPEKDRHSLALGSYNAGLGNILKAQSRANNTLLWAPTAKALPLVTGVHAKETTTYVERIWSYVEEYENNTN